MANAGDQFGNIFIATELKREVLATLQKWFPTYLRRIENAFDLKPNTLQNPKNYTIRNSFDAQAGESLPKVVVVVPGTLDMPVIRGRVYLATWSVGVGVAMAAKDQETADLYAECYGAAVRSILLQNPALEDGLSLDGIQWLEENYDDIPVPSQTNLYKRVSDVFAIGVEDITTLRPMAGPALPDQPDYPDYGEAQEVIIELDKEPINAD